MTSSLENTSSLVGVGFILSFLFSYGVGANNAANTFGTVVATKSALKNNSSARRMGIVFEVMGALLTYFLMLNAYEKKGFFNFRPCNGTERVLMSASVATTTGASAWLLVWTFIGYPVSVSHCLLGSALGAFTVSGCTSINWFRVAKLYVWSFSFPLLSATLSVLLYKIERYTSVKTMPRLGENSQLVSKYGLIGLAILTNISIVFLIPPDTTLFFEHTPVMDKRIGLLLTVFLGIVFGATFMYYYKNRYSIERLDDLIPNCPSPYQIVTLFKRQFRFLRLKSTEDTTITKVARSGSVAVDGSINYVTLAQPRQPIREKEPSCIEIVVMKSIKYFEVEDSIDVDINSSQDIVRSGSGDISGNLYQNEQQNHDNDFQDQFSSNEELDEHDNTLGHKKSRTFRVLLIITTVCSCLARGGHDVSNAVSYLFVLMTAYNKDISSLVTQHDIPVQILVVGLIGIILGMWTWWKPVMITISRKLVKPVDYISGFCIEFGVVLTIIFCSEVEIPISMTYCKITTMVAIGHASANVNYRLFKTICLVWLSTAPATFFLGALFHVLLL